MRPVLEAAAMTKMSATLPVVIQRVTPVGKNYASVLFTLGGGAREVAKLSEEKVADAITKLYGGRVRLVEKATKHLFDGARDIFRGFVAINTPVVPYETASSDGWTNVAANMFSDPTDQLWEVSGDAENRVLRRIGNDDLEAVLAERRSRSVATAVSAIDSVVKPGRHDAVVFFSTAAEDLKFGVMVDTTKAFVPKDDAGTDGTLEIIQPEAVVACVKHDLDAPRFANAPETAASKAEVLEYYRRLYGINSVFYMRLKQLIEDNLAL